MDMGVADFNAPILLAGCDLTRQEFAAIWTETLSLLPKFDAVDLQKISVSVCGVVNPLTYLDCIPYHSSGHAIHLSEPRETLYARPSISRMRAKLRRLTKKLKEGGTTEFITAPTGQRGEHVIGSLFDLKRLQYLRTTGNDFFAMPGIADFYREMTGAGRIGRISHLSALTCGSNVASAHLGFIGRGQFHWVLPAFDMEYRRFAVGHMLLHHLIEHSFDGGYTTFDLGEGDHYYKSAWATHELPLCSYERAMTPSGLLFLQMRRIRRRIGGARFSEWYWKGRARLSSMLGVASIAGESPAKRASLGEAAL
jgi:CelD/BcsL family acetyltransferase involved in cellulose biosynthesis